MEATNIYFKDFIQERSLVDIETRNGWYTWNNKGEGERHVAYGLDLFILSEAMINGDREASTQVLPFA